MAGFWLLFAVGSIHTGCRLEAVGLRPLGVKIPGLGVNCFVVIFSFIEQPVWSSRAPGASSRRFFLSFS